MPTKKLKVTAEHVLDFRPNGGGTERLVAGNGEINASNKRDLFQQQQRLMAAAASGQVATEDQFKMTAARKQLLAAVFNDKEAHRLVGERMADELYITSNRKGYARRVLARHEINQGEIPRFPVRQKNLRAVIATGPTKTETQIVRDKWLMPPEVQVWSRPFIPQNELNQSVTDVLNEKYIEALEGIMVVEDRMWYNMAKQTIGLANPLSVIMNSLTPKTLMEVNINIQRWGLQTGYMIMAVDLIKDIIGDELFIQAIDPVARHELVVTGQIGGLYGMPIISEQYRHDPHRVLEQGEFIIVSDALFHGAYSDRGPVVASPIDSTTDNVIGRGWMMHETISMAIANDRSVAFGKRIG